MNQEQAYTRTVSPTIATNKVLRNTYLLLSLTLLFSAFTAGLSILKDANSPGLFLTLVVIIGMPFLLQRVKNGPWGLVLTFAYTGFMGWMIGPVLNLYITNFSNGSQLILLAFGSTGLIFLALSAIALRTTRDVASWGKFLSIGMIIAFVAMLVNVFFLKLPVLQLGISVIFSIICGGFILYETNQIVRGGETNYIVATVTLYVSLLNIFLTLLQLFGLFGGNRN